MSANKNAQLRYQILDRCFGNFRREYTIDDLVDVRMEDTQEQCSQTSLHTSSLSVERDSCQWKACCKD